MRHWYKTPWNKHKISPQKSGTVVALKSFKLWVSKVKCLRNCESYWKKRNKSRLTDYWRKYFKNIGLNILKININSFNFSELSIDWINIACSVWFIETLCCLKCFHFPPQKCVNNQTNKNRSILYSPLNKLNIPGLHKNCLDRDAVTCNSLK